MLQFEDMYSVLYLKPMSFDEIDLPEEEMNDSSEEQALEMSEDATPTGRFDKLFGENSRSD